jgi:hypothetical protein
VRRLLPILILVSLVATVVYFWRSPQAYRQLSSALLGTSESQPYQAPAETAEKPAEIAGTNVKKVSKTIHSSGSRSLPRVQESVEQIVTPQVLPAPQTPRIQEDPLHATVKTDSAAIYNMNSSRSSVVHHLKKGDRVETDLEVVDSSGRWSLVRMSDINRSGFVRSENLERAQTAARD